MKIAHRIPSKIQSEILKSEEALKQINGKDYRFKIIPRVKQNHLTTPKDINPFIFIAIMITSFVLTDCICQSIFGE